MPFPFDQSVSSFSEIGLVLQGSIFESISEVLPPAEKLLRHLFANNDFLQSWETNSTGPIGWIFSKEIIQNGSGMPQWTNLGARFHGPKGKPRVRAEHYSVSCVPLK